MKIFISYNSALEEVNQFVAELKDNLEEELGVERVFIFQCSTDNPAGTVWTENLAREINDCDSFIAVITQKYLDSDICLKEIAYAQKKQKVIIPIIFNDHKPNYKDASYGLSIEMIVTAVNYVTFETTKVESSEYKKLKQGLRKVIAGARSEDSGGSSSGPPAKLAKSGKESVSGATAETAKGSVPESVLKETPELYDLIDLLADVDSNWNEIGMALRVDENILADLSRSPQHTAKAKLQNVITNWMKKKSPKAPVTWKYLISATEGRILGNKRKADEIREFLAKGLNADQ